ncbi:fimbrial protein [Iodobacter fluviatilis]|uniref:Minor fimbrial protein prsF n=1 Tax=Iodobacter fluviatilis TaxID=537 RepID=A0A377Q5Z3_9NEIS|nr:fimbrial protein [Iodobacter fluviatilis]TCU89314.1 type 1 fimbria pilin [Iodobacter fluviatilis]STQ90684.1 Minor fimbrial protein prsF precursor [Iodobacter fluviatilis]
MDKKTKSICVRILLLVLCMPCLVVFAELIVPAVWAAGGTSIPIMGQVYVPAPCVFNGGKNIEIDFGYVGVNNVNGIKYKTAIPITVKCTEPVNGTIKVAFMGKGAVDGSNALLTNIPDLGIQLSKDNKVIALNSMMVIDYKLPLQIFAVPVKINGGGPLTAGDFSASATFITRLE